METLGVGDAFLAMAPFIKLYSTYANNFECASNMLQVLYGILQLCKLTTVHAILCWNKLQPVSCFYYLTKSEQICNSFLFKEWEKKSSDFVSFVTRQEAMEECKGLNLRALLITPVQRVPR